MHVLGIETSCDETSAAVVKDGCLVKSNITATSLSLHRKYGGVVPEIAFRKQLETIVDVTDTALKEARVSLKTIDLISVTNGPGLLGSLLVGISFAKAIALARNIPVLGVNHLYSHIYSSLLDNQIKAPFIALIVSGGHTSLFYIRDFTKLELIGSTLDDACGEAFDKVAKILNLGYPGGPIIERIARKGNPKKIKFSCLNPSRPLDFSFSGIKTGVLYYLKDRPIVSGSKSDISASFQDSVINTLIKKSMLACQIKNVSRMVVGGGVAANSKLREKFKQEAKNKGIDCYFPSRGFCMDNAAMVAGLGYHLFKKGERSDLSLNAALN